MGALELFISSVKKILPRKTNIFIPLYFQESSRLILGSFFALGWYKYFSY